ncbi:MAG: glycosyltransferase family 9 protein, partial [Proteobacteria bacterium]
MRKMRSLWPDHKLILVCRKGVGDFFLKTGVVDQVFEIKKGDAGSYKKIIHELNAQNIDQLFATHESLRTAFFVSRIHARKKTGYAKLWNWLFFSERVRKNYELPEAIRHLSILQGADSQLKERIALYAAEAEPYSIGDNGKLALVPSWSSMSLKSFYNKNLILVDQVLSRFKLARDPSHRSVALF